MKTLLYPLPAGVNIQHSSGIIYSILDSLKTVGFNIITTEPLSLQKPIIQTGLNALYRNKLFPYQFATVHTWKTVNNYAKQLKEISEKYDFDAVFSASTLYAGALKIDKPIFSYVDFSFCNLLDYYPGGKNLFPLSRKEALDVDKYCFQNHSKVFLASEWAKENTLKAYDLENSKIHAIKQGANVESGFTTYQIEKVIEARIENNEKKILFVGINWERKGGEIAVAIVQKLNQLGYKVTLQIVGCTPPSNILSLPYVEGIGFLNRANTYELEKMRNLFTKAWCFILPSKAEAFGLAYAEAASFGLLSIAQNTGGVGDAIDDMKTGILFNEIVDIDDVVNHITLLFKDVENYKRMSIHAYEKYSTEMNWNSIALKIREIIMPLI